MSDIENRIMELEIQNAHQEDTIERLNQIVIQQQKDVDELVQHMQRLKVQLNNIQDNSTKETPEPEPPPPHY